MIAPEVEQADVNGAIGATEATEATEANGATEGNEATEESEAFEINIESNDCFGDFIYNHGDSDDSIDYLLQTLKISDDDNNK